MNHLTGRLSDNANIYSSTQKCGSQLVFSIGPGQGLLGAEWLEAGAGMRSTLRTEEVVFFVLVFKSCSAFRSGTLGKEEIWVPANAGGRAVTAFRGKWYGANSRTHCRSGMWVLSRA